MNKRKNHSPLQWHPPLYAGLQIELKDDAWNLEFKNEHQLSTKPLAIDVLIIKKNANVPIRKNIGKLFKKYNIVEYKSPGDYLSINDFYKVYAYTCLYKALTDHVDGIKTDEIAITFVCRRYPRKLIKHLKTSCNCNITLQSDGIYHISGDRFLMQVILTSKLSAFENLWLWSMNNAIRNKEIKEKLISEYIQNKGLQNYESVMDIIIRANKTMFKEEAGLCKALEELFEDTFAEREQIAAVNASISTRVEDIFELLKELGKIPENLKKKISDEKNLDILKQWHKIAAKSTSIEEFKKSMQVF